MDRTAVNTESCSSRAHFWSLTLSHSFCLGGQVYSYVQRQQTAPPPPSAKEARELKMAKARGEPDPDPQQALLDQKDKKGQDLMEKVGMLRMPSSVRVISR